MHAQSKDVDIHWGTAKPAAQSFGDWFIVSLAEFSDDLRDAPRREVMGQAGNDMPLDVFTRGATIAKSNRVHWRGNERGICCN
jgi:hypothetical protein